MSRRPSQRGARGEEAPVAEPWTHTWSWSKRPVDRSRKGQRCRVLATGRLGTAYVEFEDGVRHFTSRRGVRKIGGAS